MGLLTFNFILLILSTWNLSSTHSYLIYSRRRLSHDNSAQPIPICSAFGGVFHMTVQLNQFFYLICSRTLFSHYISAPKQFLFDVFRLFAKHFNSTLLELPFVIWWWFARQTPNQHINNWFSFVDVFPVKSQLKRFLVDPAMYPLCTWKLC